MSGDLFFRLSRMPQDEAIVMATRKKILNSRPEVDEHKLSASGCAVADFQPDDFGRAAEQFAHFSEVRVFRDNSETVCVRVTPDLLVRFGKQAAVFNMSRPWKQVRYGENETR
jgi:hypothetical protein